MVDPVVIRTAAGLRALPPDTPTVKGEGLCEDDLAGLKGLHGLSELYLDGCQELGDEALRHVAGLPGLRVFYTSGQRITDDGLAALAACTLLSEFGLDAPVTGEGFRHLAGLPHLAEIHLPLFPNGTREGVVELARLPALKKLCFYGVGRLSDLWLVDLVAAATLRELVLVNCRGVTAAGLADFRIRRPEVSLELT